MADARGEILGRIRSALADVPASERAADVPVAREYRRADDRPRDELVDLFAERVSDYGARVHRVPRAAAGRIMANPPPYPGSDRHDSLPVGGRRRPSRPAAPVSAIGLPEAIAAACSEQGLATLAVSTGLPDTWLPTSVELVRDEGLSSAELDRIDGALTGCAAAIAETGTIVLDGGQLSGRRALTLVPDHHICVVAVDQIHGQLAEALAAVATAVTEQHAPITLVSGPSATSDIELERVEGVHGPRRLTVLILAE